MRYRSHHDDDYDCDDPCIYFGQVLGDCLRSNGESDDEVDDCADCIDGAMASYNGTICGELEEAGFCKDVQSCADEHATMIAPMQFMFTWLAMLIVGHARALHTTMNVSLGSNSG